MRSQCSSVILTTVTAGFNTCVSPQRGFFAASLFLLKLSLIELLLCFHDGWDEYLRIS